jgi:thiol:disulfide interchange protein DsbA
MRNYVAALLTVATLAVAAQARAEPMWTQGKHYFLIEPAQPTSAPAGKVEVTEVFSYACPACNVSNPVVQRLKASLPANAELDYLPASFRPDEDWPMFQRAFFAAQALGVVARTHEAMFDAVWKTGELAISDLNTHQLKRPAPTIDDAAKFYARSAGVKVDSFLAAAKSFAVDLKMRRADELAMAYHTDRTPTIIVNGKYRLHAESAGGYDELIELVKWLVAKESK